MAALAILVGATTARAKQSTGPGEGVPDTIHYYETVAMMSSAAEASNQAQAGAGTVELSFETLGRHFDLKLEPHSPFAPGATVRWVDDTGSVVEPASGGQFFRGRVDGDPNSWVRLAYRGDALAGVISTDDEMYFLEPASRFFGEEAAHETLAYRLSDTDTGIIPGSCGARAPSTLLRHRLAKARAARQAMHELIGNAASAVSSAASGNLLQANVGIVADFSYFSAHGANSANDIAEIINNVDGIYQAQLGVTMQLLRTVVYSTQDPFSTSTDPSTLLTSFSAWRANNVSDPSLPLFGTDLSHLITGRDLNSTVIGIAYIDAVCDNTFGVGVDQDFTTALNLLTLLLSHEMGHNFGAYHDAQANPACPCCATSPGTFIMNPVISSSLQNAFSDCTKSFINPALATFGCLNAMPPQYGAAFVSQSVPASMTAGQQYAVSVTLSNNGTSTWTAADLYRLGAANPYDNTTWGMSRVTLASTDSVAPGQQKTFTWTVRAPSTAGTYNFQWRMVRDGVAWFGDLSTNVAVAVAAPNGPNATFVSQSVPSTMTAGQGYSLSMTVKNTGTTTWTPTALYRLGSTNPYDNVTWGMNRVLLASGDSIAPGQQKTFTWTVQAPAAAGTYNFQWRMVQDGVMWFGDISPNVAVTVSGSATPNAASMTQSVPSTMSAGQQYSVSVTMQNNGTTTWTAAGMYRLGAANPYDNTNWGMNRVGLSSTDSVAPGQQKTFTWTVRAPSTPGTYNFQWRMVEDGVMWFGSLSANASVVVQ